jgi:hypothetical protein
MRNLEVERLAQAILLAGIKPDTKRDGHYFDAERVAEEYARLAESRPSDGLERIAALEAPKPARRHFDMGWSAGFETARDVALAIVDAALTKADSAAPGKPEMSVPMSDADEGPA